MLRAAQSLPERANIGMKDIGMETHKDLISDQYRATGDAKGFQQTPQRIEGLAKVMAGGVRLHIRPKAIYQMFAGMDTVGIEYEIGQQRPELSGS